jgi:predicted molibdopterin-dependent oxidoreductase YjgC
MNSARELLTLSIDNQTLKAERGTTILQAAQQNGIYIPTLCAHKDLTSFGGCRMCIVEVGGMRSLPTACTTPVAEGMVVRTQTPQVHATRLEILRLILSEHTSSCLICDEQEECRRYSTTIRKAGVTTGCRFCPKDNQCELQDVVNRLGLKDIGYPIYYRNLRVEKEDPFYDRDYNLCILCGRCVRVCQDVRAAGTLAFVQRGRQTIIGPAFKRSHFDAGCEFCGACVSVCPTGALYEKASKWDGKPEREEITRCPLCGIGCQLRLLIKGDRVIGSVPAEDPLINNGQLCVKGRFCITELVNGHQRLLQPRRRHNGTNAQIGWADAVDLAAEKLSACAPEDFGMLISACCCNEDLYVAQKFVRVVMGSHRIDTPARVFYGGGFTAYLDLLKMRLPLLALRNSTVILCVGLDARFGGSVVGVELRKAATRGAKIITIHPRHHSLSVLSDKWIQPIPGAELEILNALAERTRRNVAESTGPETTDKVGSLSAELDEVTETLKQATAPVLLVGSEFLQYDQSAAILRAIGCLSQNVGAGIILFPPQGNLFGSMLMGVYPELLPGGFSSTDRNRLDELGLKWGATIPGFSPSWDASVLSAGEKVKLLYLIGEVPPNLRPACDFSIFQNIYPPDSYFDADLVLPSTAFTEMDGTSINGEGRIQRMRKAVSPPGEALPSWQILCLIAQRMGKSGFDYRSAAEVWQEISLLVDGFGSFENPSREARPFVSEAVFVANNAAATANKASSTLPFILSASAVEHVYCGFPLSTWVGGAKKLFAEGIVDISPKDAAETGISEGDEVVVSSDDIEQVWPARVVPDQPEGVLHVVLRQGASINPNPHPVSIRKKNV